VKRSLPIVAAVALPLMLSGCTVGEASTPPPAAVGSASTPAASDQALAPTVVSPGDLQGATITVVIGTSLVIAVPDGTEADWTGTTVDLSIAEFSGGGPSEGAVFRPGFQSRAVGKTAATLAGPEGAPIAFTLSVVAP